MSVQTKHIVNLRFEVSQPLTKKQEDYFQQQLWKIMCDAKNIPCEDTVNFTDVPEGMLAPTVSQHTEKE